MNSSPSPKLPAKEAIPALLQEHGGMIYSLGCRLCGTTEEAEDLLQETFLQAFRDWHQFEGRSSPKTWLYTIAARTCQRMQRRKVGQPSAVASLDEFASFGAPQLGVYEPDTPLDEEIKREAVEHLEQAILELPLSFRMPLILRDILEFSIRDIAHMTGLKEATVKTRLHRGRLKLREALEHVLPRQQVPPANYSRQVCLDLMQLKQEALDRGEKSTPELDAIVCERCEVVFAGMDLAAEICEELRQGHLPEKLHRAILEMLGVAPSAN